MRYLGGASVVCKVKSKLSCTRELVFPSEGINANNFQILPPDIVVINCGDKKSMFQRKTVSGNFRSTHNICSVAYTHVVVKEKFMAPSLCGSLAMDKKQHQFPNFSKTWAERANFKLIKK